MKFYCVTPCLNAEKFIEETMLSVINQTVFERPNFFLQYTVADGGSVDETVKIIERLILQFSCTKNIQISYFSEEDSGMYDALAKGFENEVGISDVYSYINAGDYYSKYAFEIISDILTNNDVHFITGIRCWYNEKSHLIDFSLPFSYNKNLVLKGLYGRLLPFIQQESTFWGKKLHSKVNFQELRMLRLAGDYYLWKTFINDEPLYIVSAWLGGFKVHTGQLSSQFREEYNRETEILSQKPTILDYITAYFHIIIWLTPNEVKKRLSVRLFVYDSISHKYQLRNHPKVLPA